MFKDDLPPVLRLLASNSYVSPRKTDVGGIMIRSTILVAFSIAAIGCAGPSTRPPTKNSSITMPVQEAWFEGRKVYYISTDISDARMAQAAGINLAPRLADAIPAYPKPPDLKTVLERVYKFPNNEQDAIFGSAPQPLGPTSRDRQYSPLWLVYAVQWKPGQPVREFHSEEALLDAEASGALEIVRSSIVVNCPIVGSVDTAESLPGTQISHRAGH